MNPPIHPHPHTHSQQHIRQKIRTTTTTDAANLGIPGRVHGGFLLYMKHLAPLIDEEMMRVKPKRVSLAGDSLGGAVANLAGVYISKKFENMITEKVPMCVCVLCVCLYKNVCLSYLCFYSVRYSLIFIYYPTRWKSLRSARPVWATTLSLPTTDNTSTGAPRPSWGKASGSGEDCARAWSGRLVISSCRSLGIASSTR